MPAAVVVVAGVVVVMVVIGVERVAQVVVADAEAVGGGQCSAHFGPVAGFAEGCVVGVEGVAVAEGGERVADVVGAESERFDGLADLRGGVVLLAAVAVDEGGRELAAVGAEGKALAEPVQHAGKVAGAAALA